MFYIIKEKIQLNISQAEKKGKKPKRAKKSEKKTKKRARRGGRVVLSSVSKY